MQLKHTIQNPVLLTAINFLRLVRFTALKVFSDYKINDGPHLPDLEKEYFLNAIRKSKVYLEYGSGGSTVFAAQYAKTILTVESDREFLEKVKEKIQVKAPPHLDFTPIYVDIGITREYGQPLVQWTTHQRVNKWTQYPKAPWDILKKKSLLPDVIFIDGRFRVACILTCLLNLPEGSSTEIIVDDYAPRKHYWVVEEFIEDMQKIGRMVSFRKSKKFNKDKCLNLLYYYVSDFR